MPNVNNANGKREKLLQFQLPKTYLDEAGPCMVHSGWQSHRHGCDLVDVCCWLSDLVNHKISALDIFAENASFSLAPKSMPYERFIEPFSRFVLVSVSVKISTLFIDQNKTTKNPDSVGISDQTFIHSILLLSHTTKNNNNEDNNRLTTKIHFAS